jgi:hypothetical protein
LCVFVHFYPHGFPYLFVCFVIVGSLFLFLFLLSFFFLYYQLYHYNLLIPTLTSLSWAKFIAPLPQNLLCPFSSTLSPSPHLALPFSQTCHQTIPPFYTLITFWTTSHNPNPLNPLHKHSLPQQHKYTQTHIRSTKASKPHTGSLTHPLHLLSLTLVPPCPTPQISIASLTNINPPKSHCFFFWCCQNIYYNSFRSLGAELFYTNLILFLVQSKISDTMHLVITK